MSAKTSLRLRSIGQRLDKNRRREVSAYSMKSERQKLAAKAYQIVRYALITGKLPFPYTLKCADCGEKAQCYDHRDYTKPLDVTAVCNRCNLKRGPSVQGVDPRKKRGPNKPNPMRWNGL